MLKREKDETGRSYSRQTASGSRLRGDQISQCPARRGIYRWIGAICIVRSIDGWRMHMWHGDVEERS
jgi:hypothetical protein